MNIQSIKVIRTKYQKVIVYVNLDNGQYECWSKEGEKKHWTGSQELLAQAKELALINGKWQNWQAPRKASYNIANYNMRCPDCGGRDCGANCNANRF